MPQKTWQENFYSQPPEDDTVFRASIFRAIQNGSANKNGVFKRKKTD